MKEGWKQPVTIENCFNYYLHACMRFYEIVYVFKEK